MWPWGRWHRTVHFAGGGTGRGLTLGWTSAPPGTSDVRPARRCFSWRLFLSWLFCFDGSALKRAAENHELLNRLQVFKTF